MLLAAELARIVQKTSNPAWWRNRAKEADLRKFGIQFAYGHNEILLDYMGLDRTTNFKGILQHGVGPTFTFDSDWPTPRVGILNRSPLWVYSESAATDLKKRGVSNVTAIGSPWLYSKLMHHKSNPAIQPVEKFLVFPRHSTFGYPLNWTEQAIEKSVRGWIQIAQGHELGVCLYWIDFLNPNWHTVLKNYGIAIHCAGVGSTDPVDSQSSLRIDFYPSLVRIISSYTHCFFQSFTSAIFYANDLGKMVGFFPDSFEDQSLSNSELFTRESVWIHNELSEIYMSFTNSQKLVEMTQDLLGTESTKEPDELKMILGLA